MAEQSATWGVVAPAVRTVLQRLKDRAAAAVEAMDTAPVAADGPQNHDEAFLRMSAAAEAADRATRDYRSIFNAYTHKFHDPKPPIGALAAMQGVVTQSFAKRYTPKTVAAIDALLSDAPDLEAIRLGIRALGFDDIWGISDALDAALQRAAAAPQFQPWAPADQAISAVQRTLLENGAPSADDSSAHSPRTGFEGLELPPMIDSRTEVPQTQL